MNRDEIRALALGIYGTTKVRGAELRSWLFRGEMAASQRRRLGGILKPECFSNERQWISWCIHEAVKPVLPASGYCADCTLAHKTRMQGMGLCQYPLTEFRNRGYNSAVIGRRHPADLDRASPPRTP